MVGYGGKDLQKTKVLSLEWKSEGVMDDESGESMEPMEEVPLVQLRKAELGHFLVECLENTRCSPGKYCINNPFQLPNLSASKNKASVLASCS